MPPHPALLVILSLLFLASFSVPLPRSPSPDCAAPPSGDLTPTARLHSLLDTSRVLVLAKSYCPYCRRAKAALKEAGVAATVVELDLEKDGADIQEAVKREFGFRTVPAVFVRGELLGGSVELIKALKEGTLVAV